MPTYKLQYFDARGVAETIRFCFAAAKVEYEDARYSFSFGTPGDFSTIQRPEFDKDKAAGALDVSAGKVPLLLVDGKPLIGQSKAIERYISKKLGLMGANDEEAAKIDALCENVRDAKDAYQAAKRKPEGAERDAAIKEYFEVTLVKWCADTEKSLPAAQSDFLVGGGISLADISWYQFCAVADGMFFDNTEGATAAFQGCPRIKAAMAACAANPGMNAHIANRPKTMF
jgi:glutathione S-transferase